MTSSAESGELFVCTMRIAFRGGNVATIPMVSFTNKADAEAFNKDRMGFIQAMSQGMATIPTGSRALDMPITALLAELGVAQVGLGIETGELRNSSLVVAKPTILLAH